MRRRILLTGSSAVLLSAPRVVRSETARTLRYMPSSDLPTLDPTSGGGNTARDHCNTIYDQLFGVDASFQPHPQMVAGFRTEAGGAIWELTLRDGLLFHDNTPVLARDCVASIRRWAARDSYGISLLARTDEIAAPSDRVIRFRLKRPFALLPEALSQPSCVMLPERVAMTDPFKAITDTTGSGPFCFLPDERVHGSSWAYARFEKYVPRPEGMSSFLAGPRVAHFDRLVWSYVPDQATKAAAMAKGDFDWWQNPSF
jgi:peptide/nickel transport system substrate-binding protein